MRLLFASVVLLLLGLPAVAQPPKDARNVTWMFDQRFADIEHRLDVIEAKVGIKPLPTILTTRDSVVPDDFHAPWYHLTTQTPSYWVSPPGPYDLGAIPLTVPLNPVYTTYTYQGMTTPLVYMPPAGRFGGGNGPIRRLMFGGSCGPNGCQ